MSGDVKAAIAETQARAKELLFGRDGKLKGPDHLVGLWVWQVILPRVTTVEELNTLPKSLVFNCGGTTHVYRKDLGDVYIAGADGDAFIDRVLCAAAAVILGTLYCIPDPNLRAYVCARLTGGLSTFTKRGRGQKKTDHGCRNAVIAGRLIPPLLDRFSATRNAETKHIESACSITAIALANVGVHMNEKRLENIWAKVAYLFVPAK